MRGLRANTTLAILPARFLFPLTSSRAVFGRSRPTRSTWRTAADPTACTPIARSNCFKRAGAGHAGCSKGSRNGARRDSRSRKGTTRQFRGDRPGGSVRLGPKNDCEPRRDQLARDAEALEIVAVEVADAVSKRGGYKWH